jgi:putative DNA-invertase from lambdoid prophage Rac
VKADQKKRGRYLGGSVPYGWQVGENGALVPVPEQQRAIKRMVQLREKGLALRAIQAKLAERGTYRERRGEHLQGQ